MKTSSAILTIAGVFGVWAGALAADPIEGLYNTGVDNASVVLFHGSRDTHYRLIDASPVVGQPFVFTSIAGFPVPPWLADSAVSAWIAPTSDGDANGPPGDYTYRLYVDLAGYDPGTVVLTGQWSTDNAGTDILVNGAGTGNPNTAQFVAWTSFTLSTVFSSGLNTVDFVLNNASTDINPTGVRVEISGTGDRVPPGAPAFVLTGPTDTSIREGGTVVFTVSAGGSYPISYAWAKNGTPIQGATRAWLELADVRQAASGTYSVTVSNPSGTESASAVLTVTPTPVTVTRTPALYVGGIVGRSYQVDVTEALSNTPVWDVFATVGPLTESPLVIPLDGTGTQRFFRALEQ